MSVLSDLVSFKKRKEKGSLIGLAAVPRKLKSPPFDSDCGALFQVSPLSLPMFNICLLTKLSLKGQNAQNIIDY